MNSFSKGVLITSLTAVVVAFLLLFKRKNHFTVIIGILSARSHFDRRDVIRRNLNEYINHHNVDLKFIVAERACTFPPQLRVNEYSCIKSTWSSEIYLPKYLHKFSTPSLTRVTPLSIGNVQGLDFTLLQDISVTHLGIYDKDQDGITGNLKVLIYNRHSQELEIGVVFLSFSQGTLFEKFRFKKCSPHFLPKGFEGTLVIEGLNTNVSFFTPKCNDYLRSDVIKIENGLRYGDDQGEFPTNFLPHTSGCFYGVSLNFTINSTSDERDKQISYVEKLGKEKVRLSLEIEKHNDIYLAPTIEVYRNLPLKMIQFYQHLGDISYNFLLKTDDDCYIDIAGIMDLLNGIRHTFSTSNLWIGNFRINFAIDKQGKWAEHNYAAISYPPFACGSGYVLSRNIVDWIGKNAKHLKIFQGEDTSLGVWLAALNVNRIHDERFHCAKTCDSSKDIFSIPENSIEELEHLYLNNGSCILSNNTTA